MTGMVALRLHFCRAPAQEEMNPEDGICLVIRYLPGRKKSVTMNGAVRSLPLNGSDEHALADKGHIKPMKRNLMTLLAVGAIAASGFAIAHAQDGKQGAPGGWHHGGNPLEHVTETLNLT
ncbi:MAG: hypothetical protein QOI34_1505, partial [Verrucomicrobiota bacterium]